MSPTTSDVVADVNRLVDDYRTQCLWYLRRDYYPSTDEERLRVLAAIERCGDRAAHVRVGALRRCLLPPSNDASVVS